MRDSLIREIQGTYELQRAENKNEEKRRLQEAIEKDPAIGAMVQKRSDLFQSRAISALSSPENADAIAETLAQEIAQLQAALRKRLVAIGLPEDYLQPVYQCPHCHDTGFTGDLIHEKCECFQRKIRQRAASVPGQGLNPQESFASYDETIFPDKPVKEMPQHTQRTLMLSMRERCESYAALYPYNPQRNILMVGSSGLGKTFLLNCIGNHVHQHGAEVLKLTAYQLSKRMRASIFDRNPEAFGMLLEVPLLILDDLGAEPLINNITIEQLFTLLNERSLAGLHTITSTNLTPLELKQRYTERVCSRLFDKRHTLMLKFLGTDVRIG